MIVHYYALEYCKVYIYSGMREASDDEIVNVLQNTKKHNILTTLQNKTLVPHPDLL